MTAIFTLAELRILFLLRCLQSTAAKEKIKLVYSSFWVSGLEQRDMLNGVERQGVCSDRTHQLLNDEIIMNCACLVESGVPLE